MYFESKLLIFCQTRPSPGSATSKGLYTNTWKNSCDTYFFEQFQDTVAVTTNMIYKFNDDEAEVPELEPFKETLVSQMLRSAFFQNEVKEDINMLKIPNIIAPRLLRKQVNTDSQKESLFNQNVNYGPETMIGLAKLISAKKIDILDLDSLKTNEVRKIGQKLCIKMGNKSNVRLLEEIKFVCKMYTAGQGNTIS